MNDNSQALYPTDGDTKKSTEEVLNSMRTMIRAIGAPAVLGISLMACPLDPNGEDLPETAGIPSADDCYDYAQDLDEDGTCGKFDCNEEDPEINHLAYDTPGDGIDQDCDGEDAEPVSVGIPVVEGEDEF